jgi:phospholipase C
MGYHNAVQVPVYDALAREFLICQRWFAAHPGPTFPNRFYTLTGRLNRDPNGRWEFDNPESGNFLPVTTKNIFDHLTAQGVTWRYYEHGYCTLRLYERYTYDTVNIIDAGMDAENFVAGARAGTLPSVTFIDPDFINVPPGNDDQPPADIAAGQRLIGRVVDALINSPRWNKTLLIITYDEHGGFFDHTPPPQAAPVSGIDRCGVRVPAFVVSPYVARGQVTDVVFDHTSIIKTIARRFLSDRPPDLGERVAAAKDLSMVLQPNARQDRPDIPVPPAPAPNPALAGRVEPAPEGDRDFRALLQSMRSRYPVRR